MTDSQDFHLPTQSLPDCSLCETAGGAVIWQDSSWRVVRVLDADHPAFYRVICRDHIVELSQLPVMQRRRCIDIVCAVEQVLLVQLRPIKVNLAAFGNVVPHLHWHVIARFDWDSHFPQPIWGQRVRDVQPAAEARLAVSLMDLDKQTARALTLLA